jgi:uncharacterized protein YcbX
MSLRLIRLPDKTVVTALSVTPVKATRLRAVQRVQLDELGARGNRTFHVIDDRGRVVNAKRIGDLNKVVADYDLESGELGLAFPDGTEARSRVRYGEPVNTRFFSHEEASRELVGPWSEALSSFLGRPLRLAAADIAVDRGRAGAVSLISRGSVSRLAQTNGGGSIDARRFRMLVEVDGVPPHGEDRWVGHRVRIGSALVAMHGHVGRCLVTSRDPETGVVDLPTLDMLGSYRRGLDATEPLPFGIYGAVVEPGTVSVGDAVTLES